MFVDEFLLLMMENSSSYNCIFLNHNGIYLGFKMCHTSCLLITCSICEYYFIYLVLISFQS